MVSVRRVDDEAPEEFVRCLEVLRSTRLRPEVVVEEVPAPQRIAPHAVALSADVLPASTGGGPDDEEAATGRFVLLYDPDGQDAWQGRYRAVTFARATLEPDLVSDPLIGQVGWTWLEEALEGVGARATALGGTVTSVVSESFGALEDRPTTVELEVRASWTPVDGIGPHLQAWASLLCTVAGLPPLPAGVSPLARRR